MEASLFKQYLEIAKEMGVTHFSITENSVEASLLQSGPQIKLEDLTREMPSDEKLLGIEEAEEINLGEK